MNRYASSQCLKKEVLTRALEPLGNMAVAGAIFSWDSTD